MAKKTWWQYPLKNMHPLQYIFNQNLKPKQADKYWYIWNETCDVGLKYNNRRLLNSDQWFWQKMATGFFSETAPIFCQNNWFPKCVQQFNTYILFTDHNPNTVTYCTIYLMLEFYIWDEKLLNLELVAVD